jgi:very-short-patch-repair endonuclease
MPRQGSTGIKTVAKTLSLLGSPGVESMKRRARGRSTKQVRSLPLPPPQIPVPSTETAFIARYQSWGGIGRGTIPEFIAWSWLVDKKKLKENIDFLFQSSQFGGRRVLGGQVVDFLLIRQNVVWRIQGEFFHLRDPNKRAQDVTQKIKLIGQGYRVVDLWGVDLLTRPDFVLEKAYNGQEIDTYGLSRR